MKITTNPKALSMICERCICVHFFHYTVMNQIISFYIPKAEKLIQNSKILQLDIAKTNDLIPKEEIMMA